MLLQRRVHYSMKWMKSLDNFCIYALRWQLSTPILWVIIKYSPGPMWFRTVIANFIGAMIFFRVDELIFK